MTANEMTAYEKSIKKWQAIKWPAVIMKVNKMISRYNEDVIKHSVNSMSNSQNDSRIMTTLQNDIW